MGIIWLGPRPNYIPVYTGPVTPTVNSERFRRTWKRVSLSFIGDMSALEVSPFYGIALHKSTFTWILCLL